MKALLFLLRGTDTNYGLLPLYKRSGSVYTFYLSMSSINGKKVKNIKGICQI